MPKYFISILIFLAIIAYVAFDKSSIKLFANENTYNSSYECDGRVYCSQMTSCEEATFFIENCPGTKMDGNNDGVPCEKQWCN